MEPSQAQSCAAHGFAEHGEKVPATISQHGGTVTANAIAETIEGTPPEGRVIIIHSASVADAQGWLQSPGYTPIKGIRQSNAETRQLIVEALPAD